MLIQEEGKLKKVKDHSIQLTIHDRANSGKARPGKKDKRKEKAATKVNEGKYKGLFKYEKGNQSPIICVTGHAHCAYYVIEGK